MVTQDHMAFVVIGDWLGVCGGWVGAGGGGGGEGGGGGGGGGKLDCGVWRSPGYTERHPQYRFLLCYRVLYFVCFI